MKYYWVLERLGAGGDWYGQSWYLTRESAELALAKFALTTGDTYRVDEQLWSEYVDR